MQIQLTQDELKDAVRAYVAKDFNLEGRTLTISFTATRGDAGVVTNLSINKNGDVEIPGYTNSAPDAVNVGAGTVTQDVAQVTSAADVTTEAKTATTAVQELAQAAPVIAADTATNAAAEAKTEAPEVLTEQPAAVAEATDTAETSAPKTTSSLFG